MGLKSILGLGFINIHILFMYVHYKGNSHISTQIYL